MTEHLTDVVIDPRDAAANRERGWWRDATLYDDFAVAAARHPDKVAIVGYRHGTGGVAPAVDLLTYRDLLAKADRFAAALVELRVRPGDVVSIHWGWACDVLDPDQLARLVSFTARELEIANQTL